MRRNSTNITAADRTLPTAIVVNTARSAIPNHCVHTSATPKTAATRTTIHTNGVVARTLNIAAGPKVAFLRIRALP